MQNRVEMMFVSERKLPDYVLVGSISRSSDDDMVKYVPERTCSYVEHSDGVYHYYQCSECQCEMAGWDFELYSPNYCMDCDAKIVKVIRDAD